MFESLENRVLLHAELSLSTLNVSGTQKHDVINITLDQNQLVVTHHRRGKLHDKPQRFDLADIGAIHVNARGGNDLVRVSPNANFAFTITIDGGDGNDSLFGSASRDVLIGGNGNDTLRGRNGDNSLIGGPGNDLLIAGNGDDVLRGLEGNDTLQGGLGDNLLFT